jgi:predicted glycoside hydrolase/deacetylase ChbG (UPF0249 family)
MTLRTLGVCADDFGQSAGISRCIARLARAERLTAVSCLVNGPHWPGSAALLGDLPGTVDVGLHFNLTEGAPLSDALRRVWPRLPSLGRLLAAAQLRLLPRAALAAEVAAQWDAFTQRRGQAPAFVDGHQHVHHLPIVRDLLIDALQRRPAPAARGIAVRSTARVVGPGFAAKRAIIAGTGGRALLRGLQRHGIAHNAALVGVYDFRSTGYRSLMQGWLAALPAAGGLLFCHPGEALAGDGPDPIAAARPIEAAYLASDAFTDDLAAAGVVLGRAWEASR